MVTMENQELSASTPEQNRTLQAFRHGFRATHPLERGSLAPRAAARPSTAASTVLQRHRFHRFRGNADNTTESPSTVQETIDRLSDPRPIMTPFWQEMTSRVFGPDTRTSDSREDEEANRKRSKRRKMDQEPVVEVNKYGYRGRVVSGPLKMDIMTCDGGFMTEVGRSTMVCYSPQNILRNDRSVYCTQTSECNIVFRHMGNHPFSLKKVVIKAPKSGFDAPYVFPSPAQTNLTFLLQSSGGHDLCLNDFRQSPRAHSTVSHSREDSPGFTHCPNASSTTGRSRPSTDNRTSTRTIQCI